jgi:hypothetical protein
MPEGDREMETPPSPAVVRVSAIFLGCHSWLRAPLASAFQKSADEVKRQSSRPDQGFAQHARNTKSQAFETSKKYQRQSE